MHACVAQNYPHVFQQYCAGESSKCDFEGLNWLWENVGTTIESPRTTCDEPSERLLCYATNYPSMFATYCKNNTLSCDLVSLQWHWTNVGKQSGLSLACQLGSTQLQCYAQNHPDIYQSYCSSDVSKCNLVGLQWHWQHVGEKNGYQTLCREPPERLRCYATVTSAARFYASYLCLCTHI